MSFLPKFSLMILTLAVVGCGYVSTTTKAVDVRDMAPAAESAAMPKGTQTAIFAGGCFWGVEAVFENVKGVTDVKSGYSGGDAKSANYDDVSGGDTLHAEAVFVTYDPTKVTYTQLLTVFFSVAHNPTEIDRQGPDSGKQYRSAIFYSDDAQKKLVESYIDAINKSKVFTKPIATQIVPLEKFYDAEGYHQDYLLKNPTNPYIVAHDLPKLADLKSRFPDLYMEKKKA